MDEVRHPGRPKGTPKTGGRVAGVKNRATRERAQRLVRVMLAEGLLAEQLAELTPLDILLRIMRSAYQAGDAAAAQAAAALAAPYVHAKLSSSDVRISATLDTKSDADLAAEVEALEAKLAAAGAARVVSFPAPKLVEGDAAPSAEPVDAADVPRWRREVY